jgi:hypothetical protein
VNKFDAISFKGFFSLFVFFVVFFSGLLNASTSTSTSSPFAEMATKEDDPLRPPPRLRRLRLPNTQSSDFNTTVTF